MDRGEVQHIGFAAEPALSLVSFGGAAERAVRAM
jgi:hypothetical protein